MHTPFPFDEVLLLCCEEWFLQRKLYLLSNLSSHSTLQIHPEETQEKKGNYSRYERSPTLSHSPTHVLVKEHDFLRTGQFGKKTGCAFIACLRGCVAHPQIRIVSAGSRGPWYGGGTGRVLGARGRPRWTEWLWGPSGAPRGQGSPFCPEGARSITFPSTFPRQ